MYLNMLRYRLMTYPGRVNSHLTLGDPSAVEFVTRKLEEVTSDKYRFHKDCGLTVMSWTFPTDCNKPALNALAAELIYDAASHKYPRLRLSDFELLAATIAKGYIRSYYGNSYWGSEYSTLHLLLCGIDWTKYAGVDTNTWTNFAGTFAEDDSRSEVLSTHLTCRCEERVDVEFGMDLPSIADMIKALGAGELERLFEV
jgi:hypothetical protein